MNLKTSGTPIVGGVNTKHGKYLDFDSFRVFSFRAELQKKKNEVTLLPLVELICTQLEQNLTVSPKYCSSACLVPSVRAQLERTLTAQVAAASCERGGHDDRRLLVARAQLVGRELDDPWVLRNPFQRETVRGPLSNQSTDQVASIGGHVLRRNTKSNKINVENVQRSCSAMSDY